MDNNVNEKEDVGTSPVGSTSLTLGKSIFTLLDFNSRLFSFEATPMRGT